MTWLRAPVLARDLFGNPSNVDTGARSTSDWYETPSFFVRSLLHFHPCIARTRVLECCSGNDAITTVLREEYGCTVYTNDINHDFPAMTHVDATTDAYWRKVAPPVEYVVSNLPFDIAFEIFTRALPHAKRGTAFLLRKSITEPTEQRGAWLHEHPPTRVIGEPRHSFRGEGTDGVGCDWFIWEHIPHLLQRPFEIDHLAKTRARRVP